MTAGTCVTAHFMAFSKERQLFLIIQTISYGPQVLLIFEGTQKRLTIKERLESINAIRTAYLDLSLIRIKQRLKKNFIIISFCGTNTKAEKSN